MTLRATLLTLMIATQAVAADAPPNTLTPEEKRDGWLLLFDGETPFGWRVQGDAAAENGALVLGGTSRTTASIDFPPGTLKFEYQCEVNLPHTYFPRATGSFPITALLTPTPKEVWGNSKLPADGAGGKLDFSVSAKSGLRLRNVKLLPSDFWSVFNGKDLAGWKQFDGPKPAVKSKFSVTPEGWLNVKDGPGDLQTEKQYADFCLQLECISNGKHLNSGVFFRCLPGQYQQGYEAQIRNQWDGDDRNKPVDFGTGAIYRRVPARRVVSGDHEWFTLTVLAVGPRLRTWVDGYPVVDFVDQRAPADNARQGVKTGAGAISIQGHDPTTDLSFRNIRVADLSPGK